MSAIREKYEAFLKAAIEDGNVEVLHDAQERRKHPRLRLPFGMLTAQEMIPREMTDISVGGFAFEATRRYDLDETVHVNLRGKVGAAASVVGCEPLDEAGGRYRVRCRFVDEEEAVLLLGIALELDTIEASAAGPATHPRN